MVRFCDPPLSHRSLHSYDDDDFGPFFVQVVGAEPQWKCFICSLECASFFSLLYHHMRHLKLKPFLCKHCNFANVKKGNLYDHCENIHRIKGGSDEDMIEIDQDQFAQMEVSQTHL